MTQLPADAEHADIRLILAPFEQVDVRYATPPAVGRGDSLPRPEERCNTNYGGRGLYFMDPASGTKTEGAARWAWLAQLPPELIIGFDAAVDTGARLMPEVLAGEREAARSAVEQKPHVLITLPHAGGYYFFGVFGSLLKREEAAKHESQRLLRELQEAHPELQAAARGEARRDPGAQPALAGDARHAGPPADRSSGAP